MPITIALHYHKQHHDRDIIGFHTADTTVTIIHDVINASATQLNINMFTLLHVYNALGRQFQSSTHCSMNKRM